jgi:hypothetical protein
MDRTARRTRALGRARIAAIATALALAGTPVAADAASAAPGHDAPRPGPEILYRPLAAAPQLESAPPWKAEPILISGASAYRKGEFLYQDYLYDDAGADGGVELQPPTAFDQYFRHGTYLYPTDPCYADNAADLVELRLKPLAKATAIRITYNTLHDPQLVATTIALGSSATARELPHGANTRAPAEAFVTVHGSTADIVDAATGEELEGASPTVSVSLRRRQVEVRIPYAAFDPRERVVRVAAASGLWDVAEDRYLVPRADAPDATQPGGAGPIARPSAFFNVAFRFAEPGYRYGIPEGSAQMLSSIWHEQRQAQALTSGDLSSFSVAVDFRKLARQVNDDMRGQPQGVPASGFMSRIFASHFEPAQGRQNAPLLSPDHCADNPCEIDLTGRLQPYGLYVPSRPAPPSGYGLTVDVHRCAGSYAVSSDTRRVEQLAQRGGGSIVITPGARSHCNYYFGLGAAAMFEAWADAAARYDLDASNVVISGLSVGGYSTYQLAAMFPDLFAAAAPIIPCVMDPEAMPTIAILPLVPSYRHVPIVSWNLRHDQSCPYRLARAAGDRLTALRYANAFLSADGDHGVGTAATQDYDAVVDWLGDRRVTRDPAHVTYVVNGHLDAPELGVRADHVYWISELRLRDESATPRLGTVDVLSHGFGAADPDVLPTTVTSGVMDATPPLPYTLESSELGAAPRIPRRDRLDIAVTNIRSLTIDPRRARVGCDARLDVETDGPVKITLRGCRRAVAFPSAR